MKPVVCIVGRPNVGKSTLFNRIIGFKKAITEDNPGVTRDRNYGEFEYCGEGYILVDTGGFESSGNEIISKKVREQIESSLKESSAIIFILDAKDGLLPEDMTILENLRRFNKPILCAVNKVDSEKRGLSIGEFYETGVEKLYPISALHGLGVDELLEDIKTLVRGQKIYEIEEKERDEKSQIRIAFIGRPNTGKSSIINVILGSDRMIVSDIPGTTRDAIDTEIDYMDKKVILIDTAGLRKKSRISMKVEEYSVSRAIKSVEKADVVNLVIDAVEGVGHQDGGIAHLVVSRGKGLCLVINKWDLVKGSIKEKIYREGVTEKIPHVSYCPVVFTSAKTGMNIEKIIETDMLIHNELQKRIVTSELNRYLESISGQANLTYIKGKPVKIFYIHQQKTMPPTFILFSNHPELIPENYKRYIENALRREYGFHGAPIRLIFKKKR
ncbi:MAG TPA: ribosome biogenesis GTPase Der [Syntrophorhabdaceae bacterium]|nr:ribosome biogenesis GTPase Der [Syntrophorhabdaceae bacterium]HOL05027.1 ribosome biogenesis GTPase Der [Syntrophorhabdaceae bacterium]HPP41251.1 ribosome biogenesis GTPase Der [Syntrophorhabdaceae bacterium]